MAGNNTELFTRKASGLVRAMSMWDAAVYGILAIGPLYALIVWFPWPQVGFPGNSASIAGLISLVFSIPAFFVYAGFGSAMPRAGGDYLYISRGLHPALGFALPIGWEAIIWSAFIGGGCWVLSVMGLAPILNGFGALSLAKWISGSNGILVTILVVGSISYLIVIMGMHYYLKVQRWFLLPTLLVTQVILVILLIKTSNADFIKLFNVYHKKLIDDPNFYNTVMQTALSNGFTENVPFSWKSTYLMIATVFGTIAYTVYSAQGLLGEVKHANNFKKLFKTFTFGGIYGTVGIMVLLFFLFQKTIGWDFMHAYAFVYGNGLIEFPYELNFSVITSMLAVNPIILLLATIGFVGQGLYFPIAVILNLSRVITAMGLDGTLPAWFGKVHPKLHSPVNSCTAFFAVGMTFAIVLNFTPNFYNVIILASIMTSGSMLMVTCLAAVFFPYRSPHIFKAAPVSKYKIGKIYLFQIFGAIYFIFGLILMYPILTEPAIGVAGTPAWLAIVLTPVIGFIWYFAYRAYRKSKGMIVDVFQEVPPE